MPELHTILRQRLGAMKEADPKDHPDPDTLTAYVEELLPPAERGGVLEHLSWCSQCRDVVALTMPERAVAAETAEEPVAAPVPLSAPRRWWFLTPQFGLVASLVAVAAGVFLVLKIPQNQKPAPVQTAQVTERKADNAASPASAPVADQSAPSKSDKDTAIAANSAPSNLMAKALPGQPRTRLDEDRTAAFASAAPEKKELAMAKTQPAPLSGPGPRDYINNQVFANNQLFVDAASTQQAQDLPQAPRPARPTFVISQGTLATSRIQSNTFLVPPSGSGDQGNVTVYPLSGSGRQSASFASKITVLGRQLHLKRQIPSISSETAGNYAMFSPGLAKSEPAEMAPKARENAADNELGQSSAFSASGMRGRPSALDLGANSFLWRVVQGRLLKSSDMEHWLDGYPASEGIDFTVVRAVGADVWAGGNDAALVHSRDGGVTWERITLGAAATGKISGIDVNRSTIRVTSSSGQSWSSQDGGRSWGLVE